MRACVRVSVCVFQFFTKRKNRYFPFASLVNSAHPKRLLLLKEIVCSWRSVLSFKVVIITDLEQKQKSALNAENTTDLLEETLQVPSLCWFS